MTANRRSLEQNALLHARLTEISEHVEWHGQKLSPTDWKDLFVADMRHQTRYVRGLDDSLVLLGLHTSDMSREEMGKLLALIEAFASDHGVTFAEAHPRPPDFEEAAR